MRMSEKKCRSNNNNSDNPLTSRRTDGENRVEDSKYAIFDCRKGEYF